jgi:subtilisin-like proprotein convertase family protein
MRQTIYSLLVLITFSGSLFAQTQEERREITSNYNLQKLNELEDNFKSKYLAQKKEAVAYALRNNIDIIIDKENGGIAVLQQVLEDGTLIYYETSNAGSAQTSSTDELYNGGSLGFNLDGTGITLGIWDGGLVRDTHQEFKGRVTFGQSGNLSTHGTHVAGTMAAEGVDPNAKGMAFNADIISYDFGNDLPEMTQEASNGLLISNHSYGISPDQFGDAIFGAYITQAADLDNLLYNAPYYCVVYAAGNSRNQGYNSNDNGYDLLTGTSNAKNAIVVANVNEVANYNGPNSVNMSVSSSWGPTDDGRIKPDISAKGVNVFSPVASSDSDYASFSGSSMASPGVAGSLALIQELHNDLNGSFVRAASLRAIMINSAREAGNAPGPDYRFGWGLMNTEEMARTIINDGFTHFYEERSLQNNSNYSKSVQAVGSNTPLKVTIAWQDIEGSNQSFNDEDNTTSRLVNDLDVRVTDANGNETQPWSMNATVPSLPANRGDNNTDNVEQIVVDNAVGNYTIDVTHKGSLQNAPQDYTIVISGIAESNFSFSSDAIQKEVCANQDAVFNLQFSSLASYNGPTSFSTSGLPGSLTADFSPNNFNSDGEVILTISNLNSVASGEYNFDVIASGQNETVTRGLTLNVLDAANVGTVSLDSPSNGQTDVSIAPTLSWQSAPNVNDYTVDVSTDSSFNSVLVSQITETTSISLPELDPDTQYFWRVSAANDCSSSSFTNASFTTEQLNCLATAASNDTPVTIPSTSPNTQTATVDFSAANDVLVHDINVNVEISHTYVSDLTLTLQSPEGTSIVLLQEECGNNDDIDAIFDDTGLALSCDFVAPSISGTISPVDNLSNFVGEDPNGTWTLNVEDAFAQDGGAIDSFSLDICDGTATFSNESFTGNQDAFSIYPNPANELITLEFSEVSAPASEVKIFDLNGKMVKSFDINRSQTSSVDLNVADLSTGVYIVKTKSEQSSAVEKLIIK